MDAAIERVDVSAYRVPTDCPESDGTLEWGATTLVLVEMRSGGAHGLGYTYASRGAGEIIRGELAEVVLGGDPLDTRRHWSAMNRAVRNIGRPGVGASAIAAMDVALWDLKARLLNLPLVKLIGQVRRAVPAYGSGGFTSYPPARLHAQFQRWRQQGFRMVKMKVGREPRKDGERVRTARQAVGDEVELFVDANGAYSRKQALAQAERFAGLQVAWFEEPVSSDDLDGLRRLCDRAPSTMEITAGEYGYDANYFRRMLEPDAVDVLQADATRCGGITGFLEAATLGEAFHRPLSAHTAPTLHQHLGCAVPCVRHVEYFHDHVRLEQMFFEGAARAVRGVLQPDLSAAGLALELKRSDVAKFLC